MATKYELSKEQIQFYQTEGYLVVERLYDAGDVARVQMAIQELTDKAIGSGENSKVLELEPELVNGQRVARRVYNPFEQHEAFRSVATDARLLDSIESLIGPNFGL